MSQVVFLYKYPPKTYTMSKANIYLKIYYTEPGMAPKKILAEVNKSQLYHLDNGFIDLLNCNHKLINKYDVTKFKPLKEGEEIDFSHIRTEIYHPLKAKV